MCDTSLQARTSIFLPWTSRLHQTSLWFKEICEFCNKAMSTTKFEPSYPLCHISAPLSYSHTLTLPSSGVPPTFHTLIPLPFFINLYIIYVESEREKEGWERTGWTGFQSRRFTRCIQPTAPVPWTRLTLPYPPTYPLCATHGLRQLNFVSHQRRNPLALTQSQTQVHRSRTQQPLSCTLTSISFSKIKSLGKRSHKR